MLKSDADGLGPALPVGVLVHESRQFLSPLLPLLESIENFLLNLLEKLEPWGILVGAIVNVIEAIFALIDAIQNIINPPSFRNDIYLNASIGSR